MSKLLSALTEERETLRELVRKTTLAMKEERKAITLAKKPPPPPANNQMEMNKALRKENARLRGMIAFLKKADDSTYKQVAEMLGVSTTRATQVIIQEQRKLCWEAQKET